MMEILRSYKIQDLTPEMMRAAATVVIVSDYGAGGKEAWDHVRATLRAVARQDFQQPAEFILVEHEGFQQQIPSDLTDILPSLKIVLSPAVSAFQLKNDGARAASAEIIAILDADCVPDTGWLRHLVAAMREHPDIAVVSGKTMYKDFSLLVRTLGLLDRAYLDPGCTGNTKYIANNNAGFRRSILLTHPFPDQVGPFGEKVHEEAIRQVGHRFLFEPRMRATHAFDGWRMVRDIRRNLGHATIHNRRVDPRIAYSWMARLGFLSIPLFFIARTIRTWSICIRSGRAYNVRWFELPCALCLAVVVHLFEIPGMLDAIRRKPVQKGLYR